MAPGRVERREFEYIRHGTHTLIAGFNVATGKVTPQLGQTRTVEDTRCGLPLQKYPLQKHWALAGACGVRRSGLP